MGFDEHAKRLLIDYRAAHLAWDKAPDGKDRSSDPVEVEMRAAKKRLKSARHKLHGKILELAELCEQSLPTDTR